MKKLKNVAQLFLALAITITSIFSNAFVVFADANPNAGKVTATKTAERIGDETSRSAKVKITVSGNPYTITTQKDREIVLVLDSSGSMSDKIKGKDGKQTTKIEALKDAANNFIDSLLTEENAGKVKIGVVWYDDSAKKDVSCGLSDSKEKLRACVNKGVSDGGGTNVQMGIKIGKSLFSENDNEQSLIVLSDGEPTFYSTFGDTEEYLHGTGKADEHERMRESYFKPTSDIYVLNNNYVKDGYVTFTDTEDGETFNCQARGYYQKILFSYIYDGYELVGTCPGLKKKPSEAAKEEADSFKGKIYSIGFGITKRNNNGEIISTNQAAETFLRSLVKNGGVYFDASDADKLNDAFKAIQKEMDIVAKDLTITDTVPNTFDVDKADLKQRYGDNVTIIDDKTTGITTIIYKFNELSSKKPEELEFTVTAKDNYYGSMYTNNGATVTGTASDGNKFYENVDGKISEDLIDPVAPIAAKTKPDNYETDTNTELVVDADHGVKSNDSTSKKEDEATSVLDRIIIVNETKYGSLDIDPKDGSLKYNPNLNFRGTDGFTYYIETTITDKNGKTTIAKSKPETVTITVKGVKTKYTVNYLEKGTNDTITDSKTISKNANNEDLYVGDKVTEYALTLNNYNLVSNSQESITLAKEGNVINFYYELKDSKIIVHHKEKGTGTTLADDDTFDGKVTETKAINAKDIKDYVVVGSNTQNVEFELSTREYTFYYEKAESAGAIAYHYIIDNNGNKTDELFAPDEVTGKIGMPFSFSPKTENLGDYEFVESKGTVSGTLSSAKHEAEFYYRLKKTDVTVRYVTIKNGNVIDLINPIKDTGRINDTYTATAKNEKDNAIFANYKLENKEEQSIVLKSGDNVITFVYVLKDAKVIVHHYEEGTTIKIADDEIINGKVTEDYTTKEANVIGYVLVEKPQNANGKFTEEVTEVIYYYKKDMGKVITRYVDEEGKVLLEETTTNGQVGTDYQTSPATITDYELKNVIGEEKGKYTKEDIIVTYVYEYVMGQGGDDTSITLEDPEIPYTGIDSENYILEYSLMGTSILGIALLLILKKKFN